MFEMIGMRVLWVCKLCVVVVIVGIVCCLFNGN